MVLMVGSLQLELKLVVVHKQLKEFLVVLQILLHLVVLLLDKILKRQLDQHLKE